MVIKPPYGLPDCCFVKELDEEAMGDDANAVVFVGQLSEIPPGPWDHRDCSKQVPLCDCEPVKTFVLLLALYPPLLESIRHSHGQAVYIDLKPLGRDLTHSGVKVRANAIEIDS